MAKQALVGGDPDFRTLHLSIARLAAQLPGQFTHLGQGLGGHRFAEAGQTAGHVHRNPATQRGVAGAQQRRCFAAWGQLQILDPVQLQRGGQVVHLGQVDIRRTDAGLLIGLDRQAGAVGVRLDARGGR